MCFAWVGGEASVECGVWSVGVRDALVFNRKGPITCGGLTAYWVGPRCTHVV